MTIRIAMAALAAVVLLSACGEEQQELRGWMENQRKSIPVRSEPVPAPKSFEPFRFENAGQSDPFSPARLSLRAGRDSGSSLRPDTQRRREALEAYPLESIRMVGHMSDARGAFALLQVDSTVYQARVGNYAGQNYGKIVRVTEGSVTLKELVQDAAGDWTERETALQLHEAKGAPQPQEKRK